MSAKIAVLGENKPSRNAAMATYKYSCPKIEVRLKIDSMITIMPTITPTNPIESLEMAEESIFTI